MKFKATSYHRNLIRDVDRVSVFKEAIDEYYLNYLSDGCSDSSNTVAFDLGCGSGVLSYLAKNYFDKIIAIDINHKIIPFTKENLADFENIEVYCSDVIGFDFNDKADLIICEMLDTGLIDEEEVPVLEYAKQFLKEEGVIIPKSIINVVEPIFMENHYIQYEDVDSNPIYDILGASVVYSEFEFLEDINEVFKCTFEFNDFSKCFDDNLFRDKYFNDETKSFKVNGIKLTSFTKLTDDIIVGPTPMLNPALIIPIDEVNIRLGDSLKIELSYVMGGGIETINTKIL